MLGPVDINGGLPTVEVHAQRRASSKRIVQPSNPPPPRPPAGKPLQLICYNSDTGLIEVGQEAIRALKAVKGPVGVVAVCGRARTGKSYILNQLLGEAAGFTVAASYRPCTKGLWLWSAPVQRVGPDGSPYHLILLDSEGIDAYNQTTQDAVQIFSLAVLLSSMFIYNQMGSIDEAALDRLSLVTELTRHIRVRATSAPGSEDSRELGGFNPTFLWLLRDFYYDLEDEGRRVSAREYLDTALMPAVGRGPGVAAKNQIRDSIKALFPDRDCFTLVRPVTEEAELRNLSSLAPERLRPQFVEGVGQLARLVLGRAAPKRVGTQLVSGPMLAGLAEAYVKAINEGAVPTISTAWQVVAEQECRRATQRAEDTYLKVFNMDVAGDSEALRREHEGALAAAQRVFKDLAVGDKATRSAYKLELVKTCETRYQLVSERKLAEAAATVEVELGRATAAVHDALRLCDDPAQVAAEVDKAVQQYLGSTSGPERWPRLTQWLAAQQREVALALVGRARAAAQQEVAAAQQAAHEQAQRAHSVQLKLEQVEGRLRDAQAAEEMMRNRVIEERDRRLNRSQPGCFACMGGSS